MWEWESENPWKAAMEGGQLTTAATLPHDVAPSWQPDGASTSWLSVLFYSV